MSPQSRGHRPHPGRRGEHGRRNRVRPGQLLLGIVVTLVACLALWQSFGQIDWGAVAIAAPFTLVILGGLGLFLSRNPHQGD
jgi:hypothetical protein